MYSVFEYQEKGFMSKLCASYYKFCSVTRKQHSRDKTIDPATNTTFSCMFIISKPTENSFSPRIPDEPHHLVKSMLWKSIQGFLKTLRSLAQWAVKTHTHMRAHIKSVTLRAEKLSDIQ